MASEQAIEAAAKAAHEVNRVYCEAFGEDGGLPWGQCTDRLQRSVKIGVRLIVEEDAREAKRPRRAWHLTKDILFQLVVRAVLDWHEARGE